MTGPLLERGLLRLMYGKDEVVLLLVTYAVFLILEDVIKLVWGVESLVVSEPYALPGNFQIGELAYPVYNLILIGAAVAIGLALAWGLYRTRAGKLLLAVIHDREIGAAMGINVDRDVPPHLHDRRDARRRRRRAHRADDRRVAGHRRRGDRARRSRWS